MIKQSKHYDMSAMIELVDVTCTPDHLAKVLEEEFAIQKARLLKM